MTIFQRLDDILKGVEVPVVVECGMCDGYHSRKMILAMNEKGTFIGFEPVPELFRQCVETVKGMLFPFAVGEYVGQKILYKSGGVKMENGKVVDRYYGSSSIKKPAAVLTDFPDMTFEETMVYVMPLDAFKFPPVDFMWWDIQGAEADAIRGATETLKRTRYLYTEYENGSYEGQVGLEGILNLLPDWEVMEDFGGDVLLRNTKL